MFLDFLISYPAVAAYQRVEGERWRLGLKLHRPRRARQIHPKPLECIHVISTVWWLQVNTGDAHVTFCARLACQRTAQGAEMKQD